MWGVWVKCGQLVKVKKQLGAIWVMVKHVLRQAFRFVFFAVFVSLIGHMSTMLPLRKTKTSQKY